MKRFRAFALREDQKYSGEFKALDPDEARQKLRAQGYEILSLEEIRSAASPVIGIFLVTLFAASLALWAVLSHKEAPSTFRSRAVRHAKTPLDMIGQWTDLRSGKYLIATDEEALAQAVRYKRADDRQSLRRMLDGHEVGWTSQYGGGQKAYVHLWRDTEHIVEIKFKDTAVVAWVEEDAIIP